MDCSRSVWDRFFRTLRTLPVWYPFGVPGSPVLPVFWGGEDAEVAEVLIGCRRARTNELVPGFLGKLHIRSLLTFLGSTSS